MKKWMLVGVILILGVSAFILFSPNQNLPENAFSETNSPQYGGTLVIGIPRDVDTFNPLFCESVFGLEITHLMLLGLADLDDQSEFAPELAQSWESSEDRLSLTYHLRKGARWADGVPVTAEDVKFTFDLLMDPEVASPKRDITEYIRDISVVDSYTVTFRFSQPYPYQIYDTAGELLPKHILKDVDRTKLRTHEFGRNPLANGPFKLKSWKSQQYIELQANENYFGKRPYLDRIIFKIVPNESNLLTQLQTGEIDMMIGVPPSEVSRLTESNPNIDIHPVFGRVYYYLGYNLALPEFEDVRVRRALSMAVDRQRIIDALLYGFGTPCVGHIPPMIPWAYNDQIDALPYDVSRARSLLAKAGWIDRDDDGWIDRAGENFEFTIKTDAANQVKADLAVIIQDQLKQVGVKVNVKLVEWTTLLDQLRQKEFQAHIGGWSTSLFIDPTPVFHSMAIDELFNYGSYSNPEVDRLIELGREELDREKAATYWKEMQELVYYDQPYNFLFWIDRIVAFDNRFKNVTPIPLSSLYNIEYWYDSTIQDKQQLVSR